VAFSHQDGSLYIHIFVASDRSYAQYHGTNIDPCTRLNIQNPVTAIGYLDHKLLQWHYNQCVQGRPADMLAGWASTPRPEWLLSISAFQPSLCSVIDKEKACGLADAIERLEF
jgi:hypothetical protein